MIPSLLEAAILAAGCSLDAFTVSFAYGTKRIKIPFLSNQIINLVCSGVLGISLMTGAYILRYLPEGLAKAISFTLLFILGTIKLLDCVTKSVIRRHNKAHEKSLNKQIKFSLFNFSFILNLYANPEDADIDASKDISAREAAALAISLSLDGLAVGMGAALCNISVPFVFFASLITDTAAVALGSFAGNRVADRFSLNLSWLSGVILIALAFVKVF